MARYIKSYSNYVLKSKHQEINDGIIYERDITTIGGRDQFAKGQIPIYKNGNFVITVNNDNTAYKKSSSIGWKKNEEGDVWTLDILKDYEKDEKSSFDKKIAIKKDYYDLRDFAYYGSCSELIRASINDILKKYPGELYIPVVNTWSVGGIEFYSFDAACEYARDNGLECYGENSAIKPNERSLKATYTDNSGKFPVQKPFVLPNDVDNGDKANLFLVSNPFEIDVHSSFLPDGADPLKYFADGGVYNYVGYKLVDGEYDFSKPFIVKVETFISYDLNESKDLDYKNSRIKNIEFNTKNCGFIPTDYTLCPGDYLGKIKICFYEPLYSMSTSPADIKACCEGKTVENSIKITFNDGTSTEGDIKLLSEYCNITDKIATFGFAELPLDGCMTFYVFLGDDGKPVYFIDNTQEEVTTISVGKDCQADGTSAIITGTSKEELQNAPLYRIRPNEEIIDDFYDNLDSFEKVILDRGNSFNSAFEVIQDNEYGYYTKIKRFTFPTTYGGYNLGSNGISFNNFLNGLVEVGEYYDERFSDNLWRSMTHESIKNFDWTFTRRYNPGDEIPYVEGGTKIQKIVRVYGREFDEIKAYIDSISDVNTITYDNVNNLPDYFFTDKLEDDGWDVRLVTPFKLTEYVNGNEVVIPSDVKKDSELSNELNCEKIERVFNEDFSIKSFKPYSNRYINSIKKTDCGGIDTYDFCAGDNSLTVVAKHSGNDTLDFSIDFKENVVDECVNCTPSETQEYNISAEVGESQKDYYHDRCCNDIKMYSSEKEYTIADTNSEFLKRFILNSKEILRHKGTIEGIEMVLGLFGLRSKNSVMTDEKYLDDEIKLTLTGKQYYKKKNLNTDWVYDYDIKEYTLFTTRIEDNEYLPNKKMYKYDWINSIKLISYNTDNYKKGIYTPYQGLPVVYRENNNVRYIYPSFQSNVVYDGNPYYQMKGGWLSKKPFVFDVNDNIIPTNFEKNNRKSHNLFTETIRNIKCVQNISELLSNRSIAVNSGDICQVIDLSGRFAVVDGYVYTLYDEADNISYFYATIENNSVTIGNAYFTDYVVVSNPYGIDGKKRINLNDDGYNGKDIKIYVIKNLDGTYTVDAHSNSSSIGTFTVFENGKYMDGDNFTNYFRINNPGFYNELSVIGWQQLKNDEYEYYLLNSIIDNNKGNNPHTGHMNYDNGHEYLTYFSHLFKHAYNENLFDSRETSDEDVYDDAYKFGFTNLIPEDECDLNYDHLLKEDTKCHYFGDFIYNVYNADGEIFYFEHDAKEYERKTGKSYEQMDMGDFKYDIDDSSSVTNVVRKPILSFDFKQEDVKHYGDDVTGDKDGVTNQIVNTKRVDIDFYIKSKEPYSNEWLEEVKYIDSVILPYVSQMIPSTVICSINYKQTNICKQ